MGNLKGKNEIDNSDQTEARRGTGRCEGGSISAAGGDEMQQIGGALHPLSPGALTHHGVGGREGEGNLQVNESTEARL